MLIQEKNSDQWMTAQEIADTLKIERATVWRWAREGRLRSYRFGRLLRFRSGDVNAFVCGGADRDGR